MPGREATPQVWLREGPATWARATRHFATGLGEMNRALLTLYGFTVDGRRPRDDRDAASRAPDVDGPERAAAETASVAEEASSLAGVDLDDADVVAFARASGDTNRLHLDDEFAGRTRFGRRIVHGTLVSGLVSAALARLPGLTIYVSQNVRFLAPVDVGQRVTAVVTVVEEVGDGRYRLSTDVVDEAERSVLEGEAVVLVDPETVPADRTHR